MTRKLLTSIDSHVETLQTVTVTLSRQSEALLAERAEAYAEQAWIIKQQTLPLLNVQRLMAIHKAIETSKLALPTLTTERIQTLSRAYVKTLEEEVIERKRVLPAYQAQVVELERQTRLKRQKIEEEMRLYRLHRNSIAMLEQTIFAMLESWLYQHYPTQVLQVLGKIIEQCIKKQWYMERIEGLEHLQRMMGQMYQYVMMEYPQTYNMIGMRVTPLTMTVLRHRNAVIYAVYSMQKEKVKQKATVKTVLKQKESTKKVQSGKPSHAVIPQREHIGTTEDLTEETPVSTGKDDFGREWFFTALRYAYSIPYWLRRQLVRTMGMPENHKYARYFGIGCIPTRRTMYGYKKQRYGREPWIERDKDDFIKWYVQRYGKLPEGLVFRERYGGFKFDL
jgi:hypothetical protein